MIEIARLESVVQSPETRKKISKLTSDTKAAVLEVARKDRNGNKNRSKIIEGSVECSINTTEHSIHTSDDKKESPLSESMTGVNGTNVGSGVNVNYTVSPAPDDGIISNLPLFDTSSHYCSLFSIMLKSRVEELMIKLNFLNPDLFKSTSTASCSAEQKASDEIMRSALTSLLELLPLKHCV